MLAPCGQSSVLSSSSMAPGCFSWCSFPKRRTSETKIETEKGVVPSWSEYATATGEEILTALESAAKSIPVPFLQDTIRLALTVLQMCKDAIVVETRVQEVQDRVSGLMIVIVNVVTEGDDHVSKEAISKAAQEIEKEVSDLKTSLETILANLNEIKSQNRLLLTIFKELNKSKIDDCLERLATALERFDVSNKLRNRQLLQDVQLRLQKIQNLTQHVADGVDHIHERLDKFEQILTNINNANTDAKLKMTTMARTKVPPKPRVFHGRDGLVQEITQLLSEESTCRVCILGPGGMGKTSLALTVVHSPVIQDRYSFGRCLKCFWVPCVEASSPRLFLQLLCNSLRIDRQVDNILEAILSELCTTQEPLLIIIDNFETTWNVKDGTRQEVNDILVHLSQLRHVAILMTMRGAEPPCSDKIEWQAKNLRPIDKDASLRIFHDLYPQSRNDQDVGKLVAAVGHMPFAVTLISKLGKKSSSTAKDLLKEWTQVGTGMISQSNSPEDDMNRSITLSFDLVRQDHNASELFGILSLLPAGTSRRNLQWWAPKATPSAIATLSDAALLLTENEGDSVESTTLFVLPVVQSFMTSTCERIPTSVYQLVQEACCQYILDHSCRYYDKTFKEYSEALAAEDTNIQSILLSQARHFSISPSDRVVKTLLRFTWHRFDTKPSIDVAQHTLDLAKSSGNDTFIAEALSVLGGTYRILSMFELAQQTLSEAYELFGKLADADVARLATECGLFLARTRTYLSTTSQQTVSFIRELQSKYEAHLNDFWRACVLRELGHMLWYANSSWEALSILREAKDIFTPLGYSCDAAEAFLFMARTYHCLGQYPNALEAIRGAANAMDSDNNHIHALIYLNYGLILITLDRCPESLQKLQISLSSFQYVGALVGVGQCLENIGYLYLKKGQYEDGLAAYEAAEKKYIEMGEQTHMGRTEMERCRRNIDSIIKKKEQNMEEDISHNLIRTPI